MINLDVVFSNELSEMKEKLGRLEVSMYSFGSSIHDKVQGELHEIKEKTNKVIEVKDYSAELKELRETNENLKSGMKELLNTLISLKVVSGAISARFDPLINYENKTKFEVKLPA